jgi:hypothetical protein
MSLRRFIAILPLFAALFASSCGSEAAKPAEAVKPVEKKTVNLYTGQTCLARMANSAIRWQADAMPVSLTSETNAEANGQDGTSSVWRATFVSLNARQAKNFACSGSLLRESPAQGVTSNMEFASSDRPFSMADFQVDSDVAAKLARENGGAKLLEKDPKQPVLYQLAPEPHGHKLVWAVIYGASAKQNVGIGLVDATTPKFLGALKH